MPTAFPCRRLNASKARKSPRSEVDQAHNSPNRMMPTPETAVSCQRSPWLLSVRSMSDCSRPMQASSPTSTRPHRALHVVSVRQSKPPSPKGPWLLHRSSCSDLGESDPEAAEPILSASRAVRVISGIGKAGRREVRKVRNEALNPLTCGPRWRSQVDQSQPSLSPSD